jgi:hypothetical protein
MIDGKEYTRSHFTRTKLEADKVIKLLRKHNIGCRIIVGDNGMKDGNPRGYWIYVVWDRYVYKMPMKFNKGQ